LIIIFIVIITATCCYFVSYPTWTCRNHPTPRTFRRSHKDYRSTRRSCVDTGRRGNQVCTGSCTAWSRPGDRCRRVGMASWSRRYTWPVSVGRRCLSTHCKQTVINWTDDCFRGQPDLGVRHNSATTFILMMITRPCGY